MRADILPGPISSGTLSADELLRRHVAAVYRETGSYLETARRLGLDRRTVKAKLESGPGEAPDHDTPRKKA
jgi:ActR/RegA family two-component response regulator